MKQLTQKLKNGEMSVLDLPLPALDPGGVLVRTRFSAISAGTEGRSVRDARLGYLAKARARNKEVRQVIESVMVNGLSKTYDMVMDRLESPTALGYSCAGEVIAVGRDVTEFSVGDRVACGGVTASHAEVVAVPRNLCVHVPEAVDLRQAAFTTIGSIALQGVRQADVQVGSNCAVIGLGLIGLITVQVLRAAGVQAIGIDIDVGAVERARRAGAALALAREQADLENAIQAFTRGRGTDAVIITAGTSSLDPVELAGRLSRQKGKVVVVGGVPTGFSREHYYRKELDLRMSCSYGPGRYDPLYEEKGVDYPVGYVRWTERRNMEAFLDLAAAGALDLEGLITHSFPLTEAPTAYRLILERQEPFVGILLEFDGEPELAIRLELGTRAPPRPGQASIGLVGAGSFARNVVLPNIGGEANLVGVATARPHSARAVADRYAFQFCTGDADEVLGDPRIDTVFVLTPHNLHAPQVLEALRRGKHVFVEKPLCLNLEELEEIRGEYALRSAHVMVGFNRRFAPHVRRMKEFFSDDLPKAINYRVNAGVLPPHHWVHDRFVGGGRIVGEVCHFVDLVRYLGGAPVESVAATAMPDSHGRQDTLSVTLGFADGSTASISYFSNGHKSLAKEHLEVFAGGRVAVLGDFRELTLYGDKVKRHRLRTQDKGHREEIARFLAAIREGLETPIPFNEICESMRVTFLIQEAIRTGETVKT